MAERDDESLGTDETQDARKSTPDALATGPGAASGWSAEALPVVSPDRYTVEQEFARGGMGRIMAARDRVLGRPVAVKELLRVEAEPSARFVREAIVTARLQHPAIVPVYEAGRWPSGEPFYAMKLVSGRPLLEKMNETQSLEERLALLPNVAHVCDAVAYAHSEGIIHRDLKPANILVGDFGETVVIDWGLAKDLREAERVPTTLPDQSADGQTIAGSVMGTPAYMPPEQARGEAVNARADVYALGAILYHLLTGEAPYSGRSVDEILDRVVRAPPVPVEKRQPAVPRDLRAIVARAMEREAIDRYPSARELAEDLRKFQTGQLIGSYDYSRLERTRLWVRRNRMPVAAVGILAAALAVTLVLSMRRILGERAMAQDARRQAERKNDELTLLQARASLEHDPTAALAWLKRLSPTSARWRAARVIAADAVERGVARDVLRGHAGAAVAVQIGPQGEPVLSLGVDGTARLWRGREARVLGNREAPVARAALSPDGKRVVTASNRGARELTVWDASGTPRRLGAHDDQVRALAWSPNGKRVAVAGSAIMIWQADSAGESRQILPADDATWVVMAWSADGARVAAGSEAGAVRVWDAVSGTGSSPPAHTGPVTTLAFAPDGRLASGGKDGEVRVWDGSASKTLGRHEGGVTALAFMKDGRLASGGRDHAVRLWDAAAPREFAGHEGAVLALAASPDGRRLASASADHTVRVWDLASGEARVLRGHDGAVEALAYAPDGLTLVTAGHDGAVRRWDAGAGVPRALRGHAGAVRALVPTPDGRTLVSGGDDGTVRLWSLVSGSSRVALTHGGPVHALAVSSDGRRVASASEDGQVGLWTLGAAARMLPAGAPATSVVFSKSGEHVAAGTRDGSVRSWDVVGGEAHVLGREDGAVTELAFSPDGQVLAALARAPGSSTIALYPRDGGEARRQQGAVELASLSFSHDSRWLAAAGADGLVRIWDLARDSVRLLRGHEDAVYAAALSPDDVTLASAGADHVVRLWNRSGGSALQLRGHATAVYLLAFSADGARLISGGGDGVRIWDMASLEGRPLAGPGPVRVLAWSADGARVIGGGNDGVIRVWSDDLPLAPRALRTWLDNATSATIADDGAPASERER